jgi:hypothetical protein
MKVTYLGAANGLRLSKHYDGENKFTPYPHVKKVNSYQYDVASIDELYSSVVDNAAIGNCLLKGNLKRELVEESRAGASDKASPSGLLVLDFDGIKIPGSSFAPYWNIDSDKFKQIAEALMRCMPAELQNVSYIAQASSSIGFKNDAISMHIIMMLDVPLAAKTIKLWLQHVNYTTTLFADQLELSVNGQSLKYPLDISVADNSKLIFIAPPTFTDNKNDPFNSADDRIVLVSKQHDQLQLASLVANLSPQQVYEKSQVIKNKLRETSGLKKVTEKIKVMDIDRQPQEVLLNPDRMSIVIADTTNTPYIRCNINGGDSKAYWFNLDNPIYMHNFKGEPIFLIEQADSDFYQSIFDTFASEMEKEGRPEYPVVFRDFNTDTYWNGIYNPNITEFEVLKPTSRQSIEDFMRTHGRPAPDFVPDADMSFDPTNTGPTVDLSTMPYRINTFKRTMYMNNAITPEAPIELGYVTTIENKCPTIFKLMRHILGDGQQEVERFFNWLAYIYQTKEKAKTAWVLSGVPGTGKGVFAYQVLRPLFGEEQAPVKTLENLEEQFNSYLQRALVCVVDEFHMASSTAAQKVANKLKNQITEPSVTIRRMRSNQVEVPNYTSFIFLTNHVDAIRIEPGDRRYNIAPRQEEKLLDKHPEIVSEFKNIPKELLHFAGALETFAYNESLVRMPVDNEAKRLMKTASLSVFEEFCQALREGSLDWFNDVLDIRITNVMNSGEIDAAQRFVKSWVADAHAKNYSIIPTDALRVVFNVLTEARPPLSPIDFKKRLTRNRVSVQRKRAADAGRDAHPIRGVVVDWKANQMQLQSIIKAYFTNEDDALLRTRAN